MHKIDKQINRLLNKIDRKLRWGKEHDFLIKMISIKADERTFVFRISASYEGNKKGDAKIHIVVCDTVRKEFHPRIIYGCPN